MKKLTLTIILLLLASNLFAHSEGIRVSNTVSNGISLGAAIAVAISWSNNRSILWAIIHGFFGWLFVIYYALTRE